MLDDLSRATLADVGTDHADKLAEWLASRQPKLVTDAHWQLIDEYERFWELVQDHDRQQDTAAWHVGFAPPPGRDYSHGEPNHAGT